MKQERTGEYVSPIVEDLGLYSEGVLCSSTISDTSLENYFGLGNNQQDIF